MEKVHQDSDELAALCTLSVSLAEILELRGSEGLTEWEIRSLAIQTAGLLLELIAASADNSDNGGVPVDHVTCGSLQLTASGRVRLGHRELAPDALRLTADNVPGVLKSLGAVLTSVVHQSASRRLSEQLVELVTSLKDGLIVLPAVQTCFAQLPPGVKRGRIPHQVLALLHEELLGVDSSGDELDAACDQPTCLELTRNHVAMETATVRPSSAHNQLTAGVLANCVTATSDSSPCQSHEGSFPEVPRSPRHGATGNICEKQPKMCPDIATECNQETTEVAAAAISAPGGDSPNCSLTEQSEMALPASDQSLASCVVAGNLYTPQLAPGSLFAHAHTNHRQDLLLEKDMIQMMRGKRSGINLATSTPNQSILAAMPPASDANKGASHVDNGRKSGPNGLLQRHRQSRQSAGGVGRRASALYSRRYGRIGGAGSATGGTLIEGSTCSSIDEQRPFNGPEFIIRAREPARRIGLSQRNGCTGVVTVVLLNGQKLEVGCHLENNTVADVTKAVFEEEPYLHPSLVGFAVLTGGEFLFPAPATRLNKAVASLSCGRLILYQRFKLYPAPHALPRAAAGLHLLYLQLRQNLLENSLDVSSNQVLRLSSLALLAEFGDRSSLSPDESAVAYFLPEHYLPEPLTSQPELLRQLTECHVTGSAVAASPTSAGRAQEFAGESAELTAERRFVRLASECRGYGRHRCSVDAREKSYNTLMLSIDPSCMRVTRCDPCGRSTTRTLHWSTVSKIEYKRTRRLIISTAGAESLTFCGTKFKLRCLEYLLQQHLAAFRDGTHLSSGGSGAMAPHTVSLGAVNVAKLSGAAAPRSPRLTSYCVRSPLAALSTNSGAPRQPGAEPTPPPTNGSLGFQGQPTKTSVAALTNENRRRSAGPPIRGERRRGATASGDSQQHNWRSTSHLVAPRETSPPPASIRMGTRIAVSTLQRQKLRSREALPINSVTAAAYNSTSGGAAYSSASGAVFLSGSAEKRLHAAGPQITDTVHAIAVEIPAGAGDEEQPTKFQALPPGVRPIARTEYRDITLHRCSRTGGLGIRVLKGSTLEGGLLRVDSVSPNSPADKYGHIMPGDVITHIGGLSLSALSYAAAVDRLRRSVDPVRLTVTRGSTVQVAMSGGVKRGSAHMIAEDVENQRNACNNNENSCGEKRSRLDLRQTTAKVSANAKSSTASVNDLLLKQLNRRLSTDNLAAPILG